MRSLLRYEEGRKRWALLPSILLLPITLLSPVSPAGTILGHGHTRIATAGTATFTTAGATETPRIGGFGGCRSPAATPIRPAPPTGSLSGFRR